MRKTIRRFAVVSIALVACGAEHPAHDDEPVNCGAETRDDELAAGLFKPGESGALGFTLMTAEPAFPIRGDNTWVIQVKQMSGSVAGAPVDAADLVVTPFMPDHGHPSAKSVSIDPTGTAGEYELAPINFWMPGLWETTIDATSPSGNDVVVFRVCIPS